MSNEPNWYCLHTRPKNEQRTSQSLRSEAELEVFCPLIRFERKRGIGKSWVTEAMFPGYVFARFLYPDQHRLVRACRGVIKIVGFGSEPSVVPEEIVHELRQSVQDEETLVIEAGIRCGEEVNVVEGPFRGLRAVVSRTMPGRARVAILMELLGMEREVEVPMHAVLPDVTHPLVRSISR